MSKLSPELLFVGFFDFALNGMPREWGALPGWLLGQSAAAAADTGPNWLALFAAVAGIGMVLLGAGSGAGPLAGRARACALTGPLCGSSLARTRTGKVRTADPTRLQWISVIRSTRADLQRTPAMTRPRHSRGPRKRRSPAAGRHHDHS